VKPVLQALLLADHVYQDRVTGKIVVAGIFHRIFVGQATIEKEGAGENHLVQIPIEQVQQAGTPFVYINLTEIRLGAALQLRLISLESNEVCFESSPFGVDCQDPLATVEVVMPLPRMPHAPGAYALELLCANELIGACRIVVQHLQPKG
jgi:hypothetical protein